MLRKITIALVGLVVIIAVGGGVWHVLKYLPKPKEQTVSTIPQGWKTYVSKYGFSVSYPPDWKLEEDKYGLEIGMEHGKAPFYLTDEKKNYMDFSYFEGNYDKYFNESKDLRKLAKSFNLISRIEDMQEINISGGKAYVFYGDSQQNPGKKALLAIIYSARTKSLLTIWQDVDINRKWFECIIKGVKIL